MTINVNELLDHMQETHDAGFDPCFHDALKLAKALQERLPDVLSEEGIHYDTEDPDETADEVEALCHAISGYDSFYGTEEEHKDRIAAYSRVQKFVLDALGDDQGQGAHELRAALNALASAQ